MVENAVTPQRPKLALTRLVVSWTILATGTFSIALDIGTLALTAPLTFQNSGFTIALPFLGGVTVTIKREPDVGPTT